MRSRFHGICGLIGVPVISKGKRSELVNLNSVNCSVFIQVEEEIIRLFSLNHFGGHLRLLVLSRDSLSINF